MQELTMNSNPERIPWEEDANLLAGILAAPADDAPRLVYADWLDEHKQPERAEFIRLQVASARRRLTPVEHSRVRDLLSRVIVSWPYAQLDGLHPPVHTVTRRGFVSELHGPLRTVIRAGRTLITTCPIESIVVTDSAPIPISQIPSRFRDEAHTTGRVVCAWVCYGSPAHDATPCPESTLPEYIYNSVRKLSNGGSISGIAIFSSAPAAMTALAAAALDEVRRGTSEPITLA